MPKPQRDRAFTLVELLVVIGIIALLISILLPTISRARRSAQEIKALSNLRQMLIGYTAYQLDNRGQVLWGYPPTSVNGTAVTAYDPVSRQTFSSVVAARYPWRLVKYCSDVWPIIHAHGALPPLTTRGDSATDAFNKAYTLSINPTFGINALFVGGHKDYSGFTGATNSPNVGKHIVFKANEVHRPTDLIVFTDCSAPLVQGGTVIAGYAVVFPPRYGGAEWWSIVGGKIQASHPEVLTGLPHGLVHEEHRHRLL